MKLKALLLIDIQNDYFPNGKMELVGSESAGLMAGKLLAACRDKNLPVFHIQHISTRPDAAFFLQNTTGVEVHPCVKPFANEPVIRKNFPNSFRETTLLRDLQAASVTELIIAGMMTHMCIDSTVRASCDLGFACTLAHDACATRDLSFNSKTVSALDVQTACMAALNGFFANVLDTASICAGL
ncbi:cysteine hydrolase family protein [Desulfovibrio legallii]|uniref:cysteine hydrolase family protein n=1 Tax=Desulfovibrio legallii TaxID=571438 RepID=UPI000B86113B